jgi:hypothetical protein
MREKGTRKIAKIKWEKPQRTQKTQSKRDQIKKLKCKNENFAYFRVPLSRFFAFTYVRKPLTKKISNRSRKFKLKVMILFAHESQVRRTLTWITPCKQQCSTGAKRHPTTNCVAVQQKDLSLS